MHAVLMRRWLLCAQSFAAYNKANPKEVAPLMARLDTMLRSLLADFLIDNAGAHAHHAPCD